MTHAVFYCEQVMNKPKILPLKSVTLEKIENMQKQVKKNHRTIYGHAHSYLTIKGSRLYESRKEINDRRKKMT